MTDRELRKLDKSELLQMLIELSGENDSLREENESLQTALETANQQAASHDIRIRETGSIAEAALQVNGVFEAAQAAADEYLESIRRMNETKDEDYRRIIEEAMSQADEIIKEAETAKAQKIAEADAYWNDMTARLERFNKDHEWFSRWMREKTGE